MRYVKPLFAATALVTCLSLSSPAYARSVLNTPVFRPPAVPLITNDPYLSIWSMADHLTDDATRHWTKHPHSLVSLIRIDGSPYRLMGDQPAAVPALPQISVVVLPTRTVYQFEGGGVSVTLTFLSALLPEDLEILSRPLSYIAWQVHSIDGKRHRVAVYDSMSSQLAVNTPDQNVQWSQERAGELTALRIGSQDQFYLHTSGDDVRIDWGYAYLAARSNESTSALGSNDALLNSFVRAGRLTNSDDRRMPRATTDHEPVAAVVFDFGSISDHPQARHVIIAYDEIWSIKFMGENLRPYWRRNGMSPSGLLQSAEADYEKLTARCSDFDKRLMSDMKAEGGPEYAQLGALAYRQVLAGIGIAADDRKEPLMFAKENTSNGDAATVDVIFPASPELLLLSPTVAKAVIAPVLLYGSSARWKFPNAPHDLEKYPIAKGTDDGGEQMPVEESGNLLLLVDAIAQIEGNSHFADLWWPALTKWANYLERFGEDPGEQLCTDDFTGHLAHNANLSVKAILALAAYGDLNQRRGDNATAERYRKMARGFAEHWAKAADDGDHYRLAFDKPNTWSQKYNLIWDQVLGLHIFPPSIAAREVEFYKSKMEAYGVPLDSRSKLTETPWSLWTASLAADGSDFKKLMGVVYKYQNLTLDRVPFTDVYQSDRLDKSWLNSRSVVGGVFVRMLTDRAMWRKWASADHQQTGPWAPLPEQRPEPKMEAVIPASQRVGQPWRYVTQKPVGDWTASGYQDEQWPTGLAMFGNGNPMVRTTWKTDEIWMRRTVTLPPGRYDDLRVLLFHNGDAEVYIDGVMAERVVTDQRFYDAMPIPLKIRPLLKPGAKVVLAIHCKRIAADQEIDAGLVSVQR